MNYALLAASQSDRPIPSQGSYISAKDGSYDDGVDLHKLPLAGGIAFSLLFHSCHSSIIICSSRLVHKAVPWLLRLAFGTTLALDR